MTDIQDAFDQIFNAYCQTVRARSKNIAWEFKMAVDKWDMHVMTTATVELAGQEYKFKSQTMDWQLNWSHDISQVEMWADWTIEHILRQMRDVFVR